MTIFLLIYAVVGVVVGVLAGLLGLGGGLVIVPMLMWCFTRQQVSPDCLMHMALGTSLATIVFTSISSFRAHHRRGSVCWPAVWRITPGIIAGTLIGSYVAAGLSTGFLKGLFSVFLCGVAIELLLNKKPNPARELPGLAGMSTAGGSIGLMSSLVGIGGGSLSVPFLIWCNLSAHLAIGTSAAIGFPIALAGAIGYIIHGWHFPGLPAHSLGYVYVPAMACIVCTSMLTAPLGVRLAHRLPVDMLKRIFAVLLLGVAMRMIVSLLW